MVSCVSLDVDVLIQDWLQFRFTSMIVLSYYLQHENISPLMLHWKHNSQKSSSTIWLLLISEVQSTVLHVNCWTITSFALLAYIFLELFDSPCILTFCSWLWTVTLKCIALWVGVQSCSVLNSVYQQYNEKSCLRGPKSCLTSELLSLAFLPLVPITHKLKYRCMTLRAAHMNNSPWVEAQPSAAPQSPHNGWGTLSPLASIQGFKDWNCSLSGPSSETRLSWLCQHII